MSWRFLLNPVYPRWRGEHICKHHFTRSRAGLSPLARGTPKNDPKNAELQRFIPAGAGNTTAVVRTVRISAVYPRWRGEHTCENETHQTLWRFIPAGAGNTAHPRNDLRRSPVYPRWRGEHDCNSTPAAWASGLSPLARGTRQFMARRILT